LIVAEFTKLKDMRCLKETWNEVLQKSKDNNVFSTWEWVSRWWQHFGSSRELRILVAQESDETIGIAPFMVSKYSFGALGKISRIEFIGSPQSNYNNFILAKKERDCVNLFLTHMMEHKDWDSIKLADVPEGSCSAGLLCGKHSGQAWKFDEKLGSLCPYIKLPKSTDDFLPRLHGRMRKHMRRALRTFREKYAVDFKTHTDFNTTEEAMTALFDLHEKRWRLRGQGGAFASKDIRDFHVELARDFAEKGWLSLCFLTADDEPVAATYSFDYDFKHYFYQSGLDPRFGVYSPGVLLNMQDIETCIRKGIREYDFMKGYESYKMRWPCEVRKNLDLHLVRKGWLARLGGLVVRNDALRIIARKLVGDMVGI
jgi:CelD/BcsL family acetyltransferase involved in cellulose biosynthesis